MRGHKAVGQGRAAESISVLGRALRPQSWNPETRAPSWRGCWLLRASVSSPAPGNEVVLAETEWPSSPCQRALCATPPPAGNVWGPHLYAGTRAGVH